MPVKMYSYRISFSTIFDVIFNFQSDGVVQIVILFSSKEIERTKKNGNYLSNEISWNFKMLRWLLQ